MRLRLKRLVLALCAACVLLPGYARATVWQPPPGHTQIPIWPAATPASRSAPDSETTRPGGPVAGRPWIAVQKVSIPTLTVYPPTGTNTGAAILVFPGGGYQMLAIDLEGTEICERLAAMGITGVLLKYRVPNTGPTWDQWCGCDRVTRSSMPIEDAQRAIRLVRAHAAEWQVDPNKIGVIGFSAGGHLVAVVSTRFARQDYPAVDAADYVSSRPDFAVALYPGHLFNERTSALNADIRVTRDTPPTFLLHAENDPVDTVRNTLSYYEALKNAHVPTELHLYAAGGHGFGLRKTALPITEWPVLLEIWLRTIGIIPAR